MPQQAQVLGIQFPGGLGLNTQDSGEVMDTKWATKCKNWLFDDQGRLASRAGYQYRHPNTTGAPVKSSHEYIDASGNKLIIFAANNAIYKDNEDGTITDISGTITTPTGDAWKFINFNGKCLGFQDGHAGIVLSTTSGSFADISYTTATTPSTSVTEALSAFGRVWLIDASSNVRYSDLLDETSWDDGGGTPIPNLISMQEVWLNGMDVGVALAEFNGYLCIFGEQSVSVYQEPWDPTASTFQLVENIAGIGCVERNSLQAIGTDILFLSSNGIESLSRVIQEKSMPLSSVSQHIRDRLATELNNENNTVNSVYDRVRGFYLLSLPTTGKTYLFDVRARMQDGTFRIAEWDIAPYSFIARTNGDLLFGMNGYLATYGSTKDGVLEDGTGGDTYLLDYESPWTDLGQSHVKKIPKRVSCHLYGASGQTISLKWAFDYKTTFNSVNLDVPVISGTEYGIAEYNGYKVGGDITSGTAEYGTTALQYADREKPMTGSGRIIKYGITVTMSGSQIALKRIDTMFKMGKRVV